MKRAKHTYKDRAALTVPEGCRELTDEEASRINGGGKSVENSNEGVANAQPGNTVTRNDKTTVTLTQGDIDWAKEHAGMSGGASAGSTNPATTTPGSTVQNGAGSPSGSSNSNATPTNAAAGTSARTVSVTHGIGQDTPSVMDATKTIVHAIGNIGIAGIFSKSKIENLEKFIFNKFFTPWYVLIC